MGGKFSSPMDIFDMFFTGRKGNREKRGRDLVHPLRVCHVVTCCIIFVCKHEKHHTACVHTSCGHIFGV